jgi:GNAT superfamily N-acetyltransferase
LKFLVSNIINTLKDNEFNFCRNWNSKVLNIDNKFLTLLNNNLCDDYFINRAVINKPPRFNLKNRNEVENIMYPLIQLSKKEKRTIYLHVSSDQTLLDKYLIENKFIKIDEIIGLHYTNYSDLDIHNLDSNASMTQSHYHQKISIVNNLDGLRKWIDVYCLSFDISKNKEEIIYKILQNKFNIFYFILSEINVKYDIQGNYVGCGILYPYKNCIALYCLGTKKEYRHKNIATNIIDFSLDFGRKIKYKIFGLQTLQKDNLLSFYEKKGFLKIYNNKIYKIVNS